MRVKTTILAGAVAITTLALLPNQVAAQSAQPASVVSLIGFRNELKQLQDEITSTVDSLQRVKKSTKNQSELEKATMDFSGRFKALETHVEKLRADAITVKARVKDHYDAWSKELTSMQSANLREKAQERLTRSQKEFDKIISQATETKEEVLPFISQLKDLVIYLNADMSEEAVDSLSHTIWKIGNKTSSVTGSIQDLVDQMDATIKSLPQR